VAGRVADGSGRNGRRARQPLTLKISYFRDCENVLWVAFSPSFPRPSGLAAAGIRKWQMPSLDPPSAFDGAAEAGCWIARPDPKSRDPGPLLRNGVRFPKCFSHQLQGFSVTKFSSLNR